MACRLAETEQNGKKGEDPQRIKIAKQIKFNKKNKHKKIRNCRIERACK